MQKLGTKKDALLEYVLNHGDLWEDVRLAAAAEEDDEEQVEDSLEEQVANLDVALFSLIEPLDTDVAQLATVLDEVLTICCGGRRRHRRRRSIRDPGSMKITPFRLIGKAPRRHLLKARSVSLPETNALPQFVGQI